jgi:hypothetical protein
LNYGSRLANPESEYLVFVHQDFKFLSPDCLSKFIATMKDIPYLGIAGVAGPIQHQKRGAVSSITHTKYGLKAWNQFCTNPTCVFTLDECFVAIPTKIFNRYKFDEVLCDSWHLYTNEYSIRMNYLNYYVYVLPMNAQHVCKWKTLDKTYFSSLSKIVAKYKDCYQVLYTSCGYWKTKESDTERYIRYLIRLGILNTLLTMMRLNLLPDFMRKQLLKRHEPKKLKMLYKIKLRENEE